MKTRTSRKDENFMENGFTYRLGLDIGIASVGAAVVQTNSFDNPCHLTEPDVRIFPAAECRENGKNNGKSAAVPRRECRSTRRRIRRKQLRMNCIKQALQKADIINIDEFMKRYSDGTIPNVYQLRYEGLDRLLTDDEFAQILIHIAKHRGFLSTRRADKKDKESGAILAATSANQKLMMEKGYRTVGEMMYLDESFHTPCSSNEQGFIVTPRNKAKDYKHTIYRSMLVDEVHALFDAQRKLGNTKATETLESEYIEIMMRQRSYDLGPGLQADGTKSPFAMDGYKSNAGECTFYKNETRAAKGTYTAELSITLQKINNLKLVDRYGDGRFLTDEEKQKILEYISKHKTMKYKTVKTLLGIDPMIRFNLLNYGKKKKTKKESEDKTKDDSTKKKSTKKSKTKAETSEKTDKDSNKEETELERINRIEDTVFVSMEFTLSYTDCLKTRIKTLSETEKRDLFDEVGELLTSYKTDAARIEKLSNLGLTSEEIDHLLDLNPKGYVRLSHKAMKEIEPYLVQGLTYDKACTAAGLDFQVTYTGEKMKYLKGPEINNIINNIQSPVVRRSVAQTVRVINAIIRKYGSPQAVNVELSREMSKSFLERKKAETAMELRHKENVKFCEEIKKLGINSPNGEDITRYRLWKDQNGICLYSGEKIPTRAMFTREYEIDHIIPYSISLDDRYQNKVLVKAKENQTKGNRLPYEYFGHDKTRWAAYENRVESLIKSDGKKAHLLKKNYTKEDQREFTERNLNDTRYATTVVYNMILQYLYLEPYNCDGKTKQVYAVNGAVTAYLRKRWGLNKKDRTNDRHHAMDAVVIACCTDEMIAKVTKYMQDRETAYSKNFRIADEETGEILTRSNFTREQYDEAYGVRFPVPWETFREEIDLRIFNDDPFGYLMKDRNLQIKIDYPDWMYGEEESPVAKGKYINYIRPMFVSVACSHKATGRAHEETIRSAKYHDSDSLVISKKALKDLKLDKDNEIKDYYNKECDPLLYEALRNRLLEYNGDGKKAFAEEFHKPKADGSDGPVVKSVKVIEKKTTGVQINHGLAGNGNMVRVDLYQKEGKYYAVPIYISDMVKKEIPRKAATGGKQYKDWRVMNPDDFLFSVYPRDLLHLKKWKPFNDGLSNDIYMYFAGLDPASASFAVTAHDSSISLRGIGIQNLELIEKCQVDMLGEIHVCRQ
jgi:CRISPR-associated endonuclease Csn1